LSDALTRKLTGPRDVFNSSPSLWTASCRATQISGPRSRRRCRLLPHLMGVRPSPGPILTGVCVGKAMTPGVDREKSYAECPKMDESYGGDLRISQWLVHHGGCTAQRGYRHDGSTCDGVTAFGILQPAPRGHSGRVSAGGGI